MKNVKKWALLLLPLGMLLMHSLYSEFAIEEKRKHLYSHMEGNDFIKQHLVDAIVFKTLEKSNEYVFGDLTWKVVLQHIHDYKEYKTRHKKTETEQKEEQETIKYSEAELIEKVKLVGDEAKSNISLLSRCASKKVDVINLLEINDLRITESVAVDDKFQELKYNIQKIMFDESGALKEILSKEEVDTICKLTHEFNEFLKKWFVNISAVNDACNGTHESTKLVDVTWKQKIKNNKFNTDASEVISLCEKGDFESAQQLVTNYAKFSTGKRWELNTKDHLRYAHLNYIFSKFKMERDCENDDIEAGRQILKNYEGLYNSRLDINNNDARRNDIALDMICQHYEILKNIFDNAENKFRIYSMVPEAKKNPNLSPKVLRELKKRPVIVDTETQLKEEAKQWRECIGNSQGAYHTIPRYEARLKSWQESLKSNKFTAKNYELIPETISLFKQLELDSESFSMLYGNQIQHGLNKELVNVANQAGRLYATTNNKKSQELAKQMITHADVGNRFLKAGFILKATYTADFCWALFDCAVAMGEGAVLGVKNTYHTITNPSETAKNIAEAIRIAGTCFGKLMSSMFAKEDLIEKNPEEWLYSTDCQNYKAGIINTVLEAIEHKLKTTSRHDLIKKATAFTFEAYTTNKAFSAFANILSNAATKVSKFAKKVEKTENIITALGEEKIKIPLQIELAQEGARELYHRMDKIAPYAETQICVATKRISEIKATANLLESEVVQLRQLFDGTRKGFAEFANKNIKIPYTHILSPEFKITKKGIIELSGFHHDMNLVMEKSKLMELLNKVADKHGIYKADVLCYGRGFPGKTFFPSDWSREKVISKIMEAYDNFIVRGAKDFKLDDAGKYIVEAATNEGIKIRMIITKNGVITTTYPLI